MLSKGVITSFIYSYWQLVFLVSFVAILLVIVDYYYNTLVLSSVLGIFGVVGILTTIIKSPKAEIIVNGFDNLHKQMILELERLSNEYDPKDGNCFLVTLSFTPAFGNISNADYYEHSELHSTYQSAIESVIHKGVPTTIVCLDADARKKFHDYWAPRIAEESGKCKDSLAEKWENQAKHIIRIVREKFNFESVKESDFIHPIFVFSTNKVAYLYAMKEDKSNRNNEVKGVRITNRESILFISEAVKSYVKPNQLVQQFNNALRKKEREAANNVCDILLGKIKESGAKIEETGLLVAYGGGKDSTWVLALIRYVQELLRVKSGKTFSLHVVTYLHPGMGNGVLSNINTTFENLNVVDTKEVEIHVSTLFGTEISYTDLSSTKNLFPQKVKEKYRHDILTLGHISEGLGRSTFCYTCNINMVATVLKYVSKLKGRDKIDYIITGDSEDEKKSYINWQKDVLNKGNNENRELSMYDASTFVTDFCEIKKEFDKEIEFEDMDLLKVKSQNLPQIFELFELFEYFDYQYLSHKNFLEDTLGFKLEHESYNFTESDCVFPAVMAHLAGLRGERDIDDYATYLGLHVNQMKVYMNKMAFDRQMQTKSEDEFHPTISDDKKKEIFEYLLDTLDISGEHLVCMVYSPFLNQGANLKKYLKRINHSNMKEVLVSAVENKASVDEEKGMELNQFLEKYVGLGIKDICILWEKEALEVSGSMISRIHSYDPYVNRSTFNGNEVTVSGR